MSAYTNLLTNASNLASQPYVPYTGTGVAPLNPEQMTGVGNVNAYATEAQPYYGLAGGMMAGAATPITTQQIQQYYSPYVQNVVGTTEAQFANQNAQQQEALTGNAIAQGALGGNRTGVAAAELANQENLAQAPVIAGLENTGYNEAVQFAMQQFQQNPEAVAYGLGNIGAGAQTAGLSGAGAQFGTGTAEQQYASLTGQPSQAQAAWNYQQYLNQMAYPFQTLGYQAGIDTGVGSLMGGTSTTTTPPPNIFSEIGGAGLGALGLASLFKLAHGGRANGVSNRGANITPESDETLDAQQRQLVAGHRRVQMFPHGTKELSLPHGMKRVEASSGVFHYDPKKIDRSHIELLSASGHENELLDLGPVSKHEVMDRLRRGEMPVAIVERDQNGTEVRAAGGTHLTAHHQAAAMEQTKSPGHTIHIEHPAHTIGARLRRAYGGVANFQSGGVPSIPYAGGVSYVPTYQMSHGSGPPRPPSPPQQPNLMQQAQQIGALSKAIGGKGLFGSTSSPGNIPSGGGAPTYEGNIITPANEMVPSGESADMSGFGMSADMSGLGWARGGGIANLPSNIVLPRGYAEGGSPYDDPMFDPINAMGSGAVPLSDDGGVSPSDTSWQFDTPPLPAARPAAADFVPVPRTRPDDLGDVPPTSIVPSGLAPAPTPAGRYVTPGTAPALTPDYGVPLDTITNALYGQESNYGRDRRTSVTGARGPMQIEPDTFAQYARPGERIDNADDNKMVGKRIVADYHQRYDGDPARIAVAYFSGPNNVSSPGNSTPWIRDTHDPNGKYVSSYVSDVLGRVSGAAPQGEHALGFADGDVSVSTPQTNGIAPSSGGRGFFDRLSSDPKIGAALMSAGFGMMSSRSPFFGIGVGEGGLQGMATYSQEVQQEAAQKYNQNRINLEAQKLSQEAEQHRATLAETAHYHTGEMALRAREAEIKEMEPKTILGPDSMPHVVRKNPDGSYTDIYSGQTLLGPGQQVVTPPPSGSAPQGGGPQKISQTNGAQPTIQPAVLKSGDGFFLQNSKMVESGQPYDYASDAPYIEKGMDIPEPKPIAGRSVGSIKTDGEYYLQTGKLPQVSRGQSPVAMSQQAYRNAVQNYGNALAASRGTTPQDVAEMWRTAPGMLRFILGPDGRSTVSLGTAVRHLDTLQQLANAWQANDVQTVNRLRTVLSREFGGDAVTNLEAAGKIVGPEIIKAIGVAGAGTTEDREAAARAFSSAVTPQQMMGAIQTTQKLLGGQLEGRMRQAMNAGVSGERFKSLIGDRPFEILTHTGAAAPAPAAAAPAAVTPGAPTPTESDRAYVKAHPEVRDKFIKRFGVEP